jgi:hypothetical protein
MRWLIVVVSKPPLSIEGRYAMSQDNVIKLAESGTFADSLTDVLRNGARGLLAQAVVCEGLGVKIPRRTRQNPNAPLTLRARTRCSIRLRGGSSRCWMI